MSSDKAPDIELADIDWPKAPSRLLIMPCGAAQTKSATTTRMS